MDKTTIKQLIIMKETGCSRTIALNFLWRGTVIYEKEDLEDNIESYLDEWDVSEEERKSYRNMILTKEPIDCWGITEYEGKLYYISYVL